MSEEERHYQNVSFHQGPQDPRMGSHRGPRPTIPQNSPQERPDRRPASAFLHREDQGLRNDLHRPASQRDVREAKFSEMSEEVKRREVRPGGPPHSQPQGYPQRPQQLRTHGGGQFHQPYPGQPPMGVQHHGIQPSASPGNHYPPQNHHFPQSPTGNVTFQGKHPPPTAPKPNKPSIGNPSEAPEKPMRQYGYDGHTPGDVPPRPPFPDDGFRESPPPPPPPTSTHPLLQQGPRPASSTGFVPSGPNKFGFNKTSPWDRAEKEKVNIFKVCAD